MTLFLFSDRSVKDSFLPRCHILYINLQLDLTWTLIDPSKGTFRHTDFEMFYGEK